MSGCLSVCMCGFHFTETGSLAYLELSLLEPACLTQVLLVSASWRSLRLPVGFSGFFGVWTSFLMFVQQEPFFQWDVSLVPFKKKILCVWVLLTLCVCVICMLMYACSMHHMEAQRPEAQRPEAGLGSWLVTGRCELPCRCCGLNLGLLTSSKCF